MGHDYLGAEHLFLAIIRDGGAVPTQVLARAVNPASIENSILNLMRSPGYTTPTRLIHRPLGPDHDGM
jgi:Clp amino terminal domain, pathogenicity island component